MQNFMNDDIKSYIMEFINVIKSLPSFDVSTIINELKSINPIQEQQQQKKKIKWIVI